MATIEVIGEEGKLVVSYNMPNIVTPTCQDPIAFAKEVATALAESHLVTHGTAVRVELDLRPDGERFLFRYSSSARQIITTVIPQSVE